MNKVCLHISLAVAVLLASSRLGFAGASERPGNERPGNERPGNGRRSRIVARPGSLELSGCSERGKTAGRTG